MKVLDKGSAVLIMVVILRRSVSGKEEFATKASLAGVSRREIKAFSKTLFREVWSDVEDFDPLDEEAKFGVGLKVLRFIFKGPRGRESFVALSRMTISVPDALAVAQLLWPESETS